MRSNFAQFFSILILSLIAMWCYTGFQANVIGGRRAGADFERETNFADGWIYGKSFDGRDAKKIRGLSAVYDVQLRTHVLGKADEKYHTAEIYCYFQHDAVVTKPYVMSGKPFDPADTEGVWLFYRFANAWGLKVGDEFTVHALGQDFTRFKCSG